MCYARQMKEPRTLGQKVRITHAMRSRRKLKLGSSWGLEGRSVRLELKLHGFDGFPRPGLEHGFLGRCFRFSRQHRMTA